MEAESSLFAALRAKEQGLPPVEAAPPMAAIGGYDLPSEVSYSEKVAGYYTGEARRQSLAPDGLARQVSAAVAKREDDHALIRRRSRERRGPISNRRDRTAPANPTCESEYVGSADNERIISSSE